MDVSEAHTILQDRLKRPAPGWLDIQTNLDHFALISYAVPKARLRPYIPASRFIIPEFEIDGQPMALLSVVPFLDNDFHFSKIAPFLKFRFPQTNYRIYVIDRKTKEHVVWFLGTTLGSFWVQAARRLWQIPWHPAQYKLDCQWNAKRKRYDKYQMDVTSSWGAAEIELFDTGQPMAQLAGFSSLEETTLILTHPVRGFYYRLNQSLGGYTVWHEKIPLTHARPGKLYFNLLERLNILTRDEMLRPHSALICPQTQFAIQMPPQLF